MSEEKGGLDDELIENKDTYTTIKDEITCDICLSVIIAPKQCTKCEKIYCNICITDWKKKNKACPMRCPDFVVQDAPRVVRNMLSKLQIKCPTCNQTIWYDKYTSGHIKECQESLAKVKCPYCDNNSCKVSKKLIDSYLECIRSEYEKKIESMGNEIKSLKEVINILNDGSQVNINTIEDKQEKSVISSFKSVKQGNNLALCTKLRFLANQKKTNHVFKNDYREVEINYSSCWNFYFVDKTFSSGEESFALKILNLGTDFTHHYIGFMNDEYKQDCLCLYQPNAWYIHEGGEKFRHGKEVLFSNKNMIMSCNAEKIFRFNLNASSGKLSVVLNDTNEVLGTAFMTGKNFRFFVAKCNNGKVQYTLYN